MQRPFLVIVIFTLGGCYADFGDQAMDWVERNTRMYSEKLARADYQVRWKYYHEMQHIEFLSRTRILDVMIGEAFEAIEQVAPRANDVKSIATDIAMLRRSRKGIDYLIDIQTEFERLESSFRTYDQVCSLREFQYQRLAKSGRFNVADSFMDMAHQAYHSNQERFGVFFFTNFDTDPNGDEIDEDSLSSSEDLKNFLKTVLFVYNDIHAFINQDKIEKQTETAHRAIDRFNELLLTPDELYVISKGYCELEHQSYADKFEAAKSAVSKLRENWNRLIRTVVLMKKASEDRLLPVKIKYLNGRLQMTPELERLFDEEFRFQILTDVIKLVAEKNTLRRQWQSQSEEIEELRSAERYADALVETSVILKKLSGEPRLIPEGRRLNKYLEQVNSELEELGKPFLIFEEVGSHAVR